MSKEESKGKSSQVLPTRDTCPPPPVRRYHKLSRLILDAQCDGQRPACHHCQDSGFTCTYDTLPEESRSGTLKRKYAELEQKAKSQEELLDVLRGASEEEAARAFQQIRQGERNDRLLAAYSERNSRRRFSDDLRRRFEDPTQTPSVAIATSGRETGRQGDGLFTPRAAITLGSPHSKASGSTDTARDHAHDSSSAALARTSRDSVSRQAKSSSDDPDRFQSNEKIQPKSPGCRHKDIRSVQARDWGAYGVH